jgi:hypothetical protein
MNEILDWFGTLLSHWQYWLSGSGFGGAVVIATGMYERFRGRTMSSGTYGLVFVVCFLVGASFMAWRDERHERISLKTTLESAEAHVERPYVLIEELSPAQIRARAMAIPSNPVLPEGAYERAYLFGKAPTGEALFYNYRNIGKVPARDIKHYPKIAIVDEQGRETPVSLPPSEFKGGTLLFPEQFATYTVIIPDGTVFTGSAPPRGTIRIRLILTYSGQESDRSLYFYEVVLKGRRYANPEAMSQSAIGGIAFESMNEGIVKNLDELLR